MFKVDSIGLQRSGSDSNPHCAGAGGSHPRNGGAPALWYLGDDRARIIGSWLLRGVDKCWSPSIRQTWRTFIATACSSRSTNRNAAEN